MCAGGSSNILVEYALRLTPKVDDSDLIKVTDCSMRIYVWTKGEGDWSGRHKVATVVVVEFVLVVLCRGRLGRRQRGFLGGTGGMGGGMIFHR